MGKKQTCPAVKMKARKAKILAANKHCNIPEKCPPAKVLEADFAYQDMRDARKKELRKHSRTSTGHIRLKSPWYMLTKGKVYRYDDTAWLKVESESSRLYKKTIIKKFTRDDLTIGYLGSRMEDWKKLHPEPKTDDLFYKDEHQKWVSEYEEHHDKVVKMLVNSHITKYNKNTINAVLESRYRLNEAALSSKTYISAEIPLTG